MSSTNVHSSKYVCGGYTIFTGKENETVKMPPEQSGKGPSREYTKNNGMEIQAYDTVVMKENGIILKRTTVDGRTLSENTKNKAKVERIH